MKKLMLSFAILLSLNTIPAFASGLDHKFKKHVVGIFAGITKTKYSSENSYGLEYEFRFNRMWGVGVVYEDTPDSHDDHHGHFDDVSIQLGSVYWHYGAFRAGLGVGQEKIHGAHSYTENVVRASLAYDFHLTDTIGIAPSFSLDRVNEQNNKVYGVVINFMF